MHNSAVCAGLSFYRGKTVTFIAPTGAGSPYDIASRAIAKEMGDYLRATVNVVDIATGQSIPGQDDLAASQPNGLTIGFLNIGTDYYDILANQKGPNFNPKNLVFLGGPKPNLQLIATQSSSPLTSFASVFRASFSTPVKFLGIGGTSTALATLLFKSFGLKVDFITGYPTGNAMIEGFQRGDGNLIAASTGELRRQISLGFARILASFTTSYRLPKNSAEYGELKSVPTVPELLRRYPPKTSSEKKAAYFAEVLNAVPDIVLAAPSAVRHDLVATLVTSVKYAIDSPYYRLQIENDANALGYLSPRSDKSGYVKDLRLAGKMAALLKINP